MLEIVGDLHACYCVWEFDKFIDFKYVDCGYISWYFSLYITKLFTYKHMTQWLCYMQRSQWLL